MATDQGVIKGGKITFLALPYPLPKNWREKFINHTMHHPGDFAGLEALESRCRAAIGVLYTRDVFLPAGDDK